MSVAIYYHPEAYTTRGPRLMGRHAAGESFLRGFLTHSNSSALWIQVEKLEDANGFSEIAKSWGRFEPVRVVGRENLDNLAEIGVAYHPGPGIGKHAFQRAAFGHGQWSLCGVTHTTSSAGAMDALVDLITSPIQAWDALVCTSTAVRDNVQRVLQGQVDYLQDRLGITKLVLPQMPVIPLGVHTSDFYSSDAQRANARGSLCIDEQMIVVLFMGRLSFHAKAHPLAMYAAIESATRASGKSVVLIECGWHANDYIKKAYEQAALKICPSVRVIRLDGRSAENRRTAWAAADICCSLVDNIQETFGIVPVEAMAAGLPLVVSNWDGYRDTVRDGIDGFHIPTLMPKAGLASDLALRHALEIDTYDMYCGYTSSLIAVDIQAAGIAFEKLFNSSELRRSMGQAGKTRAAEHYDWKNIIVQYESLWQNLSEIREANRIKSSELGKTWPARMDPFFSFGSYPTVVLDEHTMLEPVDPNPETAITRVMHYRELAMVNFATSLLPTDLEIRAILMSQGLSSEAIPNTAASWISSISEMRKPYALRSLAWLVKLGVLRLSD